MKQGQLIPFARDGLMKKIAGAEERIWLASPFLSLPVAEQIAEAASKSTAQNRRLLTALDERSVAVGVLNPRALEWLHDAGFQIGNVDNLHAKVSLVGLDWGLVGSGNLTGKGLGDEEGGGNYELGVVLTTKQIQEASAIFADWWKKARDVSADEIAEYKLVPRIKLDRKKPRRRKKAGSTLPVVNVAQLQQFLTEELDNPRRYWVDANYHNPKAETWWHQEWISGQPEVAYKKGDVIIIYLGAKNGGPKLCPAIVQATTTTEAKAAWVANQRDDNPEAPERWPNVTHTTILGEVPVSAGVPLELINRTGESLRRGYLEITRAEFEILAGAMIRVLMLDQPRV
jgi:hypothetical protein